MENSVNLDCIYKQMCFTKGIRRQEAKKFRKIKGIKTDSIVKTKRMHSSAHWSIQPDDV